MWENFDLTFLFTSTLQADLGTFSGNFGDGPLFAYSYKQDPTITVRGRVVPLVERNGQYYTHVSIDSVNTLLLVDTGASTTAISNRAFAQIAKQETSYLGNFTAQTAGGNLSSPIYRISNFKVGSEILNNISVVVLPTENLRNFDGLLGINVIRSFNVEYDPNIGGMRMFKKEK